MNRPSVEFLRECFECRDGVLYWKQRPASHFIKPADQMAFNTKTAGKEAGKRGDDGYVHVGLRVNGKSISMAAHRVVWAMHYGVWPNSHLDHINRVRHHNRIENLREATPAENNANSAKRRVHPYVGPHRFRGFQAQVRIADTQIHVGIFDTEEEANAHRLLVNAALEGLARSLAKKSKTGRKRKDGETFPRETPMGGKP